MGNPEQPTLVERFVRLIPLRYPIAALAWSLILGTLGYRIAYSLQNGSVDIFYRSPSPVNELLGVLLGFYQYYIVRYLRMRIVKAELLIIPITSGGEKEYLSLFGRLTDNGPIIIIAAVVLGLYLLASGALSSITVASVYGLATSFIAVLAFSSFVWEYSISSWGLHKLGGSQLKLKSFFEDRFMGARSIGNVALSLTVAYLGGLLIFFLDSATFLPVLTLGFEIFYLVMLALGVVMFFLPLNSVHAKMQAEKVEHQRELGQQLLGMKQGRANLENGPAFDKESAVEELVRLKNLEITERRLSSTATWPFDAQLLAKLITIILSITAVLLSRIITDVLHI